jgi:hypothetical protein
MRLADVRLEPKAPPPVVPPLRLPVSSRDSRGELLARV